MTVCPIRFGPDLELSLESGKRLIRGYVGWCRRGKPLQVDRYSDDPLVMWEQEPYVSCSHSPVKWLAHSRKDKAIRGRDLETSRRESFQLKDRRIQLSQLNVS
jgi:hypothetical protein